MFSVVIPVYKTEPYLAACVQSVLSQESACEVIVVNDGSPGPTDETIEPFLSRIKYLKQENSGVNAARNHGATSATGEFLLFLDSDDLYDEGFLNDLQRSLDANPDADVLYGGFTWADESGSKLHSYAANSFQSSHLEILQEQCIAPIMAVAIRQPLFSKLGGFDGSMKACEDWDLWLRAALAGATFTRVETRGAIYRRVPGSVSNQFIAMWRGLTRLHEKHAAAMTRAGYPNFVVLSADHFLDRYLPEHYGNDLTYRWLQRRTNRAKKLLPLLRKQPHLRKHILRRAMRTMKLSR